MSGAELIRLLKASGTGKDKLEIGREVIRVNAQATAADVAKAMADAGVPEGTLQKVSDIITHGRIVPAEVKHVDIEDVILGSEPSEAELDALTAPKK